MSDGKTKNVRALTEEELAALTDEEYMELGDPIGSEEVDDPDEGATFTEDSGNGDAASQGDEEDADQSGEGSDEEADTGSGGGESGSGSDEPGGSEKGEEGDDGEDGEDEEDPEGASGGQAKAKDQEDDLKSGDKSKDPKDPKDPSSPGSEKDAEDAEKTPDYKAMYESLMGEFKASGRTVKPQTPEEARALMQMGVDYSKKMNAMRPHLKIMKMLEEHQLMDPQKLSYLIDLDRKNPEAIKKLLKDSGIDPMDIDTSEEPKYVAPNRQMSDEEFRFTSTLDDIQSTQEGKKMILEIHNTWDSESKKALWSDPDIMKVMTSQKHAGIYDQIAQEIERRKTFGGLQNVPFIQAYQMVGQEMQQAGKLVGQDAETPENQQNAPAEQPTRQTEKKVVDKRPARRQTKPATDDRVRAAAPSRAVPGKGKPQDFNPLAMSDEDFMKAAETGSRF